MQIAITRAVSPSIGNCELTHLERQPIDVPLAERQHHAYEQALRTLGCEVIALPAEPDLPDAVFVEDCAIVLDEAAVITRPGATSRRPEIMSIAAALKPYRELITIQPPATIDGGDVLRIGKQIFVGLSSRSDREAVLQMQAALGPRGYTIRGVQVTGCLHLKSAVTLAGPETLLVNPEWVDASLFPGMRVIEIDPAESFGANTLWIGDSAIYPASYPRTRARLEAAGVRVVGVDVSELIKAEGAVTCCSLVFTSG